MRKGAFAALRAFLAPRASSCLGQAHASARCAASRQRGLTTASQFSGRHKQQWAAAASAAAVVGAACTALLWCRLKDTRCSAANPCPPASDDAVLSTLPQMLSHIGRRRNVRATGGEDGFVAWLQHDFSGKDQLFTCDIASFHRFHAQQSVMLTQHAGGVKLMELVPDVEDCSANELLCCRAAVVSDAGDGDALHIVHVPSGSSSPNMLPPALRVRSIISSPSRPEHLLLITRSATSPLPCDDVHCLDLTSGQLILHCRNPGFVTQWAADLATLSVRACVCTHAPQLGASSPSYVKARGRGGEGPWVHVCELPNGGHVAGFADSGASLLVMARTDVAYTAEKHLLSPLLSDRGKRHKDVLCSNATGQALALQVCQRHFASMHAVPLFRLTSRPGRRPL